MKKILLFTPLPPPMHGSNYMAQLLTESALKKYFIFKIYNASYVTLINEIGRVSFKKFLFFIKHIFMLIYKKITFKPDYIIFIPSFNSYSFIRDFIIIFISRRILNNKNILWVHTNIIKQLYDNSGFIFRLMLKEMFNSVCYVIPCAKNLQNNLSFYGSHGRVRHIYNGIDIGILPKKHLTDDSVKIIYLSNMQKSKGWEVLFTCAKVNYKDKAKVIFNFYGSESKESSNDYINKCFKLYKNINYYGPIYGMDKYNELINSDIFVFVPVEPEAFPLVILEAMACGLPVVTTDQGGITEAIIDGKGGFIVKKNDPQDLAEKLEILINDKELRLKMGAFNRQRYLENFTFEKFEKNWIEFFNKLKNN